MMGEAYGVAMAVYIRIFRELDCIGFCLPSIGYKNIDT